ncbi:MAG: hypothetical protein J6C13_03655, partial [Clostridia bacterium]|nr:hypothetical protein [Clostridia bacterium]
LSGIPVVQTYNGAVAVPSDNSILYPTEGADKQAFYGSLMTAEDYLNLFLFNGMAAVIGMENVA